jgi:WD40 repeat protein
MNAQATTNSTACPSPSRLRALFEGQLAEAEDGDLAAHLDQCAACRERLVGLEREYSLAVEAGSASADLATARQSLQVHPPPTGGRAATDAAIPALSAELPSGYLEPAGDPQLLGCIGQYEILERIGNGGMGVVLKGRDPRLGRMVAIKVLAPHLAASGAARQRFGREARAAAAISHENVVTIHAVEDVGGLPLLVMQYVPGSSLREKIDQEGPLDVRRIVRIALQTAAGLAAAHVQGVIHRDIKPGNILLENGIEKVRLTDFGLATASDDVALTQTGCLAGTPQYMSPEQIQGGTADARSDLFSLGSVMYEMCTGRPAFRGSNPYAVLNRVCQEMPRPIREINPDVPEWLAEIVQRLLAKNPAERFQSAAEVVDVLRQGLVQLQQPARLAPVPTSAVGPPPAAAQTTAAKLLAKPPPELPAELRGPAVGLQLAAIAQLIVGLAMFGLQMVGSFAGFFGVALSFGAVLLAMPLVLLTVGLGIWQLIAASSALSRGSISQLRTSSVLAALPLSPAWLLGLPIAVWTWMRLQRHASSERPKPWAEPRRFPSLGAALVLIALALVVGLALAIVLVYVNLGTSKEQRGITKTGTGTGITKTTEAVGGEVLVKPPPAAPPGPFPLGPRPLVEIDLERAATGAVAFAPDGNLVAIGDADGFVRLHFVRTGEKSMTLIQSREPIRRVAFSPASGRLASARELAIDVWDLSKKSLRHSIEPAAEGQPAGGQKVLHFLDENRLICDRGRELVIFDGQTPAGSMSHPSALASGDVSPDEQVAATGDELGLVKTWKLEDRSLIASFEAGNKPALVRFLTGSLLAVACGRQMSVYNLQGERLAEVTSPADAWPDDMPGWLATCRGELVARVGSRPAGGRKHGRVLLWRWAEPRLAANFAGVADEPLGAAADDRLQRLAIVTSGRVHLFDLSDLRKAQPVAGDLNQATVLHAGLEPRFTCASVTANGRFAATGQVDGSLAVWDLTSPARITRWQMSPAAVTDVQFSPHDDQVLAGDEAGNVDLWTRAGQRVWHSQVNHFLPHDHTWEVKGVGFRPPFVLYGYQSRKSGGVAGMHGVRPDKNLTIWMGSDSEQPCNDVAVAADGTAWMIDDHGLSRERITELSYGDFRADHSRRFETRDYLGTVAVTGTGYPLVGTALPASLTAQERHKRKDHACVRLIEPEGGHVLRVFPAGSGEVTALAASEWRLVAAAVRSAEQTEDVASEIIVWDALLGSELVRWTIAEEIRGLALVPSGRGGQPGKLLVAGERLVLLPLPTIEATR